MNGFLFDAGAAYKIAGFGPPAPEHSSMGGWGFTVDLSLAFARKCHAVPMEKVTVDRVEGSVRDQIVARLFTPERLEFDRARPTFTFYDGTSLLQSVEVPGVNGCLLYVEPDSLRELAGVPDIMTAPNEPALTYITHNVDTIAQAVALLSCWLRWVNGMAAHFSTEAARS